MSSILEKSYLVFPLLSAMAYAFAAVALNASSNRGFGQRRTIVACNVCVMLAFSSFYDWSTFPQWADPWWPSVVLGGLFMAGQAFTVVALSRGEVSSVAPVFGVKVIFVAVLASTMLGEPIAPSIWFAAFLSTVGIACLQTTDQPWHPRRNLSPMALAGMAALSFAAFDLVNQRWSPVIGFGRLVPPAMAVAALLSLLLLIHEPVAKVPARKSMRSAIFFLTVGAVFFALQGVLLIRAIGVYGDATGANIVYGTRGLWGIVMVCLFGTWFGNRELSARAPQVLWARIFGAVLVTIAMVLAFV